MLAEEREHLAPAVERLLRPISDAGGIEERMAGTVVAVKLVLLAELFQHRLGAIDLIAVGILIVVAEEAEQRATQLLGEINGCNRPLGIELALVIDDHVA